MPILSFSFPNLKPTWNMLCRADPSHPPLSKMKCYIQQCSMRMHARLHRPLQNDGWCQWMKMSLQWVWVTWSRNDVKQDYVILYDTITMTMEHVPQRFWLSNACPKIVRRQFGRATSKRPSWQWAFLFHPCSLCTFIFITFEFILNFDFEKTHNGNKYPVLSSSFPISPPAEQTVNLSRALPRSQAENVSRTATRRPTSADGTSGISLGGRAPSCHPLTFTSRRLKKQRSKLLSLTFRKCHMLKHVEILRHSFKLLFSKSQQYWMNIFDWATSRASLRRFDLNVAAFKRAETDKSEVTFRLKFETGKHGDTLETNRNAMSLCANLDFTSAASCSWKGSRNGILRQAFRWKFEWHSLCGSTWFQVFAGCTFHFHNPLHLGLKALHVARSVLSVSPVWSLGLIKYHENRQLQTN